ncbi:hypothetical protein KTH72_13505, partial [Acinetobacter lwoffii]|uniref:hypothetical protein n=1 Tax=Acinetobacter lwoffii TaxID=28090 RepID=UPI0021CD2CC9
TSYPSCNLNFSNLGKLCRQRLYATKPFSTKCAKFYYNKIERKNSTLKNIFIFVTIMFYFV